MVDVDVEKEKIKLPEKNYVVCTICSRQIQESMRKVHLEIAHKIHIYNIDKFFKAVKV